MRHAFETDSSIIYPADFLWTERGTHPKAFPKLHVVILAIDIIIRLVDFVDGHGP